MSKILLNSDAMPFGLSFNTDSDAPPIWRDYSLDPKPWRRLQSISTQIFHRDYLDKKSHYILLVFIRDLYMVMALLDSRNMPATPYYLFYYESVSIVWRTWACLRKPFESCCLWSWYTRFQQHMTAHSRHPLMIWKPILLLIRRLCYFTVHYFSFSCLSLSFWIFKAESRLGSCIHSPTEMKPQIKLPSVIFNVSHLTYDVSHHSHCKITTRLRYHNPGHFENAKFTKQDFMKCNIIQKEWKSTPGVWHPHFIQTKCPND